jgi:general L-amino acid transport system permease protein
MPVLPADATRPPPATSERWSWRTRRGRALVHQAALLAALVAVLAFLWHNTAENLAARQIRSGFDFLSQPAGFDIGESPLEFTPRDTLLRAFVVGVVNTLRVAVPGIVVATLLGVAVGVGRLSRNLLLRALCTAYVEVLRNIPLIIQLFGWYLVITELLPVATEPLRLPAGAFLSKSGLQFPLPEWAAGWWLALAGLGAGATGIWAVHRRAARRRAQTGVAPTTWGWTLALIVGLPVAGWFAGGAPARFSAPEIGAFDITGGGAAPPEFLALLLGLSLFTSAYIAEIVRSGVLAVPHGQTEAAGSLGLSRWQTLRLVLLPQALRVIVPPVTSQYLNLTKNSSLAVAIGYPDVVSIANTTINQNGQALECVAMIMAVYLAINLVTAVGMNAWNRRVAIVER